MSVIDHFRGGSPRRAWLAGGMIVVALLGWGCGEVEDTIEQPRLLPPATIADLVGPWRASPLGLDAAMRAQIEQVCRRDIEFPAGSFAAIIDVRGAGVATVRMTGRQFGSCDALHIAANGAVNGAGGGTRAERGEQLAPLAPTEIAGLEQQRVEGGELRISGSSVYGRIGPDVVAVTVVPRGQPAVIATVANGWFAAWWPVPARDPAVIPETPPFLVQAYDASGAVASELASP
jgi:hypothetical protein